MSLPHAVLGALDARDMTGYELATFFEGAARWVWTAPKSQIYPLLKNMERDGLIRGEEGVRGTKLKKVIYSLTEAGRAELHDWLTTPHAPPPTRDSFLLQALFLDTVEPQEAERVLCGPTSRSCGR